MQTLLQDFRHAVRTLGRQPGYLATALLTLALGIGFSTATFSVVNAVLLKPLPYDAPENLVRVLERNLPRFPRFSVAPLHYLFWRDHQTAFEGIGAWAVTSVTVEPPDAHPQRVRAERVTANLFAVLGVQPALGRPFDPAEESGDRARVALLSHGAWQRRFGGDSRVVGQTVRIDRHPVTIVGVMPQEFRFLSADTELWLPLVFSPAERASMSSHFMGAVARLRPGVTLDAARADMQRVAERLGESEPAARGWEPLLFDLQEFAVGDLRASLYVLFGAVSLVLLIACANVANLLLARGAARGRELAIRASIGASRGRLLRQLLVEQLTLALASGAAGVLLAGWLLRVMLALVPNALPVHVDVSLDRQVLGFAIALVVLTPLLFGLVPAVHASRADLRSLMSAGGRQGSAAPARRTRAALVVAEIALAMMLLVGAGLLIRSFAHLTRQSPGFEAEGTVLTAVTLPPDTYPRPEHRERFLGEFLERLRGLPEVSAAAFAMPMPMVDEFNSDYVVEGEPEAPGGRPITLFYAVSPGFLDAMRIPLLRGRFIDERDRRGAPRVAVISQALAEKHFGDANPLGKRIRIRQGTGEWREIVGVVGNVKQEGLDERPRAQVYEPYLQHSYFSSFSLVVRTTGPEPAAIVPDIRAVLKDLDAALPLGRVRTFEEVVAGTTRPQRFSTTLIGTFATAALVLAAIGVYGVIAYTVGLRRQEFAIRVAHGAQASDILRLVLGGAAAMAFGGIVVGLGAAWLMRGLLQTLLFDVSAADPLTYLSVAGVLALTALAASATPAMRAAHVDPMDALRGD